MINKINKQKGVAVVVSVLFIGVILSIVLTLSSIFIPKIKNAAETKNSVTAVYAAETALEWCLFTKRVMPIPSPTMFNGSTYSISDCGVSPVKAIGSFRNVTRAFEINF